MDLHYLPEQQQQNNTRGSVEALRIQSEQPHAMTLLSDRKTNKTSPIWNWAVD